MNNTADYRTPSSPKPRYASRVLTGLLILLIVAAVLVLGNQRAVLDWMSLRRYTPPAQVAALAGDDTMTPVATHDFYVNRPSIEGRDVFKDHCDFKEQTIVLGCYHGNQAGIYILDVTDARLNGVEQVTAAHEMLHAAYDRLSSRERTRIDGLLQDFYTNQVSDPRIKATIDNYRKTEPNDVVNEMHSIFGTEIAQLPADLEQYYSRYFTNRAKVVAYASAYSNEFTSRQQQVAAYDAQLKQLKATIDTNNADLLQERAALQSARAQLDAERNGDPAAYNRAAAAYNARVDAFNAKVTATKALINQYNDIVDTRNKIALEEQALAQAISGSSVPSSQ